jgi:hypothetical protein
MNRLAFLLVLVFVSAGVASAANEGIDQARIGEVRAMAISRTNADAVAALHRSGWLEAQGELVAVSDLPQLFKAVGRDWTSDAVAEGQFAVPEIHDQSQRRTISSDNPFGVLGPGDVIQSGRPRKPGARPSPLSYWIFTGQDVSQLTAAHVVARR